MNATMEQADALVEKIGYTDHVEDYETNELGHVYTLQDGSTLIVTSPTEHQHCVEGCTDGE